MNLLASDEYSARDRLVPGACLLHKYEGCAIINISPLGGYENKQ